MIRAILGTLAGLVLAFAITSGFEFISGALYGTPSAAQMASPQAMAAFVAALPLGAMLLVLAGWACGSYSGALAATKLAEAGLWPGYIVTTLFFLGGAMNFVVLPHPRLMVIAGIFALAAPGMVATHQAAER